MGEGGYVSVAWWPGGAGGAIAPPAGLKNGGATEHKGRLKTERFYFSVRKLCTYWLGN